MHNVTLTKLLLALILACWPLQKVFAVLDADGAGMSYVWESAYRATTLSAAGDADSDRKTNLEEALAGTDPLEARSILATREIQRLAQGGAWLTWPTIAGKRYQVQASSDLKGWTNLGVLSIGDGLDASVSIPNTSALANGRVAVSRWRNIRVPGIIAISRRLGVLRESPHSALLG